MALRVLHVGKFYPPYRGGMEVFLSDLIAAQHAQGIEAHALVHGAPQSDDPHWLERVPVQFQLVYAPFALGFRAALARAIRRLRPDVLHLHMPNNSALWALTLPGARRIPWVIHWHSDVVVSEIKLSVALAYALYRPFEHALLDGAERIIATSPPYLEASKALQYWRSKCVTVPLGIDLGSLPAATSSDAWSPGTALKLLSIGRLTYYKGFETLIQAVAALPGVELLIVGDGELRDSLQARIQAAQSRPGRGNIRLLGDVDDARKHALLATCDIFCLASRERTEAFGIVLLEAMFHAKPCIVTDLPGSGMPWLVAHARAGLRVPIEDVDGWRNAITRLRHDIPLRQRLGAAGRQALLRSFTIHSGALAIEREYRHVTSKRRPATGTRGPLVVIPACNDAGSIASLVHAVREAGLGIPLVIDNRSADGTCLFAQEAGARVLRPLIPMSRWGAVQTGMRLALAEGHRGILTVIASQRPAPRLWQELLEQSPHADAAVLGAPGNGSPWWRRVLQTSPVPAHPAYYSRAAMESFTSTEAALLDDAELGLLWLTRHAGMRIVRIDPAVHAPEPIASPGAPARPWWSGIRRLAATALFRFATARPGPLQRRTEP
ncbi:glycosyl transferase family 1 [Paracidovorax avenae]|nr:glycosyl transferase family 1 [Paracidovorax avenae]